MEVIKKRQADEQYIHDLAQYSIATNLVRALPDTRDGLKPVIRRIIYTLFNDEKAVSVGTKVKSATAEGAVMRYHPHGGSYPAFKTLVNWFEIKEPIAIGQGSFGTVAGEGPSAARYTEIYLSQFGLDCVCGALKTSKKVVDWQPTYNGGEEPKYLPVKVPLLLVNGILGGIGTGVKADLPTHNLSEVINATLKLMDNPKASVVLVPDHCLPCDIIDTDWKNICNKGFGSYRARATMDVSYVNDVPYITITSLPTYGTTEVVRKIEEGITSGKFPQIADVLDESKSDNGVKIIIKLKKGVDVNFVKEALFKYTPCEQSFRVNFEVVLDGALVRLSYKEYLNLFITFAINNKVKEYYTLNSDLSTRADKLEAFIKIVGSPDIDKIIDLIKNRNTKVDEELEELLISKYKLNDNQARYIINAQIKQLSKGYLNTYKAEYKDLVSKINWYETRIADINLIISDVRNELIEINKKYGKKRICNIIKVNDTGNIPEGNFRMIVTENNYIRKLSENDPINPIKGDKPKFVLNVSNLENILLFDNKGKVFRLPVHKIPIIAKNDPGIDIKTVIKNLTADIVSVIYEPIITNLTKQKFKTYIAILSKNNCIKKLDIQDFLNVPLSGITYSKIIDNDDIVGVNIIDDNMDIIVYSESKALRMSTKDIALLKRNTIGSAAMGGNHNDIEGMCPIYINHNNPTKYIIVITESGKINKFLVQGFKCKGRNKDGDKVIDIGKNDRIKFIGGVNDSNTINIISTNTKLSIPVSEIQLASSISKGIKCLNRNDVVMNVGIA